ncbi:MAG TPA: DUF4261 domain-containing protein [Clostridium sp.]
MINCLKEKSNLDEKNKDLIKEKNIESIGKSTNEENKNSRFALFLFFPKSFIMDRETIIRKISKISNDEVKVEAILDKHERNVLYYEITIGNEKFELLEKNAPMSEEICNITIELTHVKKEELDAMRQHNYHIIAFYTGESTDQNKIYNSYAKLAYGFLDYNLLGMANFYSCNALTASLIKKVFEDENEKDLFSIPALTIWRNFLRIPHNDKVWFVTKGNNVYGIHEYAFYGTYEEGESVYEMFEDIFEYTYETKANMKAGDVIEIEKDKYLKLRKVYELEDELEGIGIGTLVIENSTGSEINK